MSETFNFNRFWTYFKYDLKQMWRRHSKAAILIGGSIAFLYVIWVMFSLVFSKQWTAPPSQARWTVFMLAFVALELYQTRTYGYLTEKRAGSSWLMVPASRTEKFVSMLLITLLVIPPLFLIVFFLLDGFLSLLDPTYGTTLLMGMKDVSAGLFSLFGEINSELPILMSPSALIFSTSVGLCCNFLYYLLCGISFKKNKLFMAIMILFGLSVLSSIVLGMLLPTLGEKWNALDPSREDAARWLVGIMNASVAFACLLTIGLGWGVWRRIKTLQH